MKQKGYILVFLFKTIIKRSLCLFNNNFFLTLFIISLVLTIYYFTLPPNQIDSRWYIELAKGHPYNVIKPFSTRILYPLIVGNFSEITKLTLNDSFLVINALALIAFIATITIILKSTTSYSIIALPLLFSPFLLFLFSGYYLPELFYASLLSLFIVCIIYHKYYHSLILLFLLLLTRENTVILSLSLVAISVWKSQKMFALVTIIVTILGLTITYLAALQGGPNVHNLNPFFYMVFKIPANFLNNVMGLRLWTDTLAANPITAANFSQNPLISVMLPKWLQLGGIHKIGISPFTIEPPIYTIECLLTIFGVAPSLLFVDLKSHYQELKTNNYGMLIILLYGVFSFIIGTSSGADTYRLISYGWPAFIIATPILIYKHYSLDLNSICLLFIIHSFICWMPWIFTAIINNYILCNTLIIVCAIIFHYLAIRELRKARVRT